MGLKRLKDQSGTSAVEFAIIAPVFLFMIAGMLAYGIYFGAAHSVQQAAADAARASVAGLDNDERRDLAEAAISASIPQDGFLKPDHVTVTVTEDPDLPEIFYITVTYDAAHLPIWDIGPPLPLPSPTIQRTSAIRHGGA
jgi:Flp pilus assembly protein TadG